MRKYTFRLASVLKLKIARENALLGELAEARRLVDEEKERLYQIRAHKVEVITASERRRRTGGDPMIESRFDHFLDSIDEQDMAQVEVVQKAQEAADAKLAEALVAMKERKSLEKLNERQREEHAKEASREEINMLDEFSSLRAARTTNTTA